MAYTGRVVNGLQEFLCDSLVDLANIDRSRIDIGTTAFIIANSERYMLNNQRQWVLVELGGGGGGGYDPKYHYIWDGGLEQ